MVFPEDEAMMCMAMVISIWSFTVGLRYVTPMQGLKRCAKYETGLQAHLSKADDEHNNTIPLWLVRLQGAEGYRKLHASASLPPYRFR